MTHPTVLIFNSLLLPPSQTFVRDLTEQIQDFTAYYVGSRRVAGLELPNDRTLVINHGQPGGKVIEQLFKLRAIAPDFYRQLQRLNPVLINAQFGLSGALILPWAERLNIPLLVHYRGADATIDPKQARYQSLNHWIYHRRLAALQTRAALFLPVSDFIRDRLLAQGFPPDRTITHYGGVDVQRFQADPAVARERVVLFVGRLAEKKGCDVLIQAIAAVQAQAPDVELIFIGDGPLRADLEAQAKTSLKRYQFLGMQPPEMVKTWMNRARIFAAPSVTAANGDSEGLPTVIVEAQAMGLPVVSTIHAGIPEAVIHGETGFLTPERDVDGLAHHCLALLQSDELWERISRGGRSHMEQNFNHITQIAYLEDLYRAVLNGEPPQPQTR
jgi:glycosyltransferase involved in cell wall biosynthesis